MFGGAQFNPQGFIAGLIVFVVAITIHEFMHAFTAYQLGDNTAARLGRVTLNPVAHFDPLGFLMLIVLLISPIGFAWGRPVPVNPANFRNPKRGMVLVAAAGPLSNLVQATILALVWRFFGDSLPDWPLLLIETGVRINILLAAFNMLPIPPLDGHKILTGLLPDFWYPILAPLEQYGFAILLALLFLPSFLRIDLVGPIVIPVSYFISNILGVVPIVFR